ncbi:hypothetical protein FACS1894189_3430 [Planctomycetales bacterium]|nr:hypothetical protein FACS1894189_3430 [Planctomycetales bacterium]
MIAVDLGNTRAKFALFDEPEIVPPVLAVDFPDFGTIVDWLNGYKPTVWRIAQTGKFPWDQLQAKLTEYRPQDRFIKLSYRDIPISIDVEFPDQVGLDRLLSAYGAVSINRRAGGCASGTIMVVDAGTAITVDLAGGSGSFFGGAILPGLNAAADSLTGISHRLPQIQVNGISSATYPGKNTEQAIAAGIYWGTVGAVRQLHEQAKVKLSQKLPIFLTGGDAPALYKGLTSTMPNEQQIEIHSGLVLFGIGRLCVKEFCNGPGTGK